MLTPRYFLVDFDPLKTGLSPLYQITDTTGAVIVAWTNSGVIEIGRGKYGVNADVFACPVGTIEWDPNDGSNNNYPAEDFGQEDFYVDEVFTAAPWMIANGVSYHKWARSSFYNGRPTWVSESLTIYLDVSGPSPQWRLGVKNNPESTDYFSTARRLETNPIDYSPVGNVFTSTNGNWLHCCASPAIVLFPDAEIPNFPDQLEPNVLTSSRLGSIGVFDSIWERLRMSGMPPFPRIQTLSVDAETVIAVGDFVYLASGKALPLSAHDNSGLTESQARQWIAQAYSGRSLDAHEAGEAGTIRVAYSGEWLVSCNSDAYTVDQLIGAAFDGEGNFENQKLAKVSMVNEAMGKISRGNVGYLSSENFVEIRAGYLWENAAEPKTEHELANFIPGGLDGLEESLAAIQAKTDLITATKIQVVSSIILSGQILPMVSGDDYSVARSAPVKITPASMPDRTGATVRLHIADLKHDIEAFVVDEYGTPDAEAWLFEPTADQTSLLERADFGRYQWAVIYHYTVPDDRVTKAVGGMIVKK